MPHVDEGQLHAYLDRGPGDATAPEWSTFESHLAVCEDCRGRLEEARRLRDRAQEILAKTGRPRFEAPPFAAIEERARARAVADADDDTGAASRDGRGGGGGGSRGFRVGGVPLAWAATIMIAVGAGWMARQVTMTSEYGQLAQRPGAQAPTGQTPARSAEANEESADRLQPTITGAEITGRRAAGDGKADDALMERANNEEVPLAAAEPNAVPSVVREVEAPADARLEDRAAAKSVLQPRTEVAEQEAKAPDADMLAVGGVDAAPGEGAGRQGVAGERARGQAAQEPAADEDEAQRALALEALEARADAPAAVGVFAQLRADTVGAEGHAALGCYELTVGGYEGEERAPARLPQRIEILATRHDPNIEADAYFRDAIDVRSYALRVVPEAPAGTSRWFPLSADSVVVRMVVDAMPLEMRLRAAGGELIGVVRAVDAAGVVADADTPALAFVRGRQVDCATLD